MVRSYEGDGGEYLQANLRVLNLQPLRNVNLQDIDNLELVHELIRLYGLFQQGWLTIQSFFAPGKGE